MQNGAGEENYKAALTTIKQLTILLDEYDKELSAARKGEKKYKTLYDTLLKKQQLSLFDLYNVPF